MNSQTGDKIRALIEKGTVDVEEIVSYSRAACASPSERLRLIEDFIVNGVDPTRARIFTLLDALADQATTPLGAMVPDVEKSIDTLRGDVRRYLGVILGLTRAA